MKKQIMVQISEYVAKLNQAFNRSIVTAIHFPTLPSSDDTARRGDKLALKKSLLDMKD